MQSRLLPALLFLIMMPGAAAFAAGDTLSLYFPSNSSALTEAARKQLDAAIYDGLIGGSQPLQIIGYADVSGSAAYNLRLSNKRAVSIKSYLIASGFRPERITLVIGKGEAGSTGAEGQEDKASYRRVDLVRSTEPAVVAAPREPVAPPTLAAPKILSQTDISTVAVGELLVLDKIYFEPGRHFFLASSAKALEDLINTLKAHPKVKIRIEGHVCCTPGRESDGMDEDTHKEELSVNRALAVHNHLIRNGIAEQRLEYKGLGGSQRLIWPELTEADMSQNRRVEIRIIE